MSTKPSAASASVLSIAMSALLVTACGGGDSATHQADTTAAAAAAPAPAAATGATHDVQMVMEGSTYKFVPDTLTIHVGDVVRFHNVSGFPHNVSFWADSIPAGAASVLEGAMADQMQPLQGPMMTTEGQIYEVSFAGAPTGAYKYYCLPHLALGMTAKLTVMEAM